MKKLFKTFKNEKGQTLVEVMVSFSLIMITLGALSSLVMVSKNLIYDSENRTTASLLAQEGIDIARNSRDVGCSFDSVATKIEAGITTFVIKGDINGSGVDNNSNDLVELGGITPNQIDKFSGFERKIEISNVFPPSVILPSCISPDDDPSNFDCQNRYYYMKVTITWPNSGAPYEVSTLLSKELR